MTTKNQGKSEQEDRNGPVKVGKLSRKEDEPIKDLSARDAKTNKGWHSRTDPTTGYPECEVVVSGGCH